MRKRKVPKRRDFHKLEILRGNANGKTSSVSSKKTYKRKIKHKGKNNE